MTNIRRVTETGHPSGHPKTATDGNFQSTIYNLQFAIPPPTTSFTAKLPFTHIASILADAMTCEAASTPPRKRSWKRLLVAFACVAAVTLIALLLIPPKKELVAVWSVGSTNYNGVKMLLFQGTNGTAGAIVYTAAIITNLTTSSHPRMLLIPLDGPTSGRSGAGESFTFYLAAPAKEPAWRVVWYFWDYKGVPTRWDNLRSRCAVFLERHGMGALAWRIRPGAPLHYIASTEIKE